MREGTVETEMSKLLKYSNIVHFSHLRILILFLVNEKRKNNNNKQDYFFLQLISA